MGHVLRDFFTGTFLVIAGVFLSIIALIILVVLGLFFHVIGILASGLFLVLLLFLSVWLVGYVYRKAREINRK